MPTIQKQEAIVQMIGDALRLAREGRYASAITLAGAAEEAMPDPAPEKKTAFGAVADVPIEIDGKQRPLANYVRNWLKHHNENEPVSMAHLPLVALTMLMRVFDRYSHTYGMQSLVARFGQQGQALVEKLDDEMQRISQILK